MASSRELSATLPLQDPSTGLCTTVPESGIPPPDRAEPIPPHLLDDGNSTSQSKRLIMAIDFGTTFSAVSYVALSPGEKAELVLSNRIRSIQNYPEDMNSESVDHMKKEVPTEVIYPSDRKFRKKANLESAANDDIDQVAHAMEEQEAVGDEDDQNDAMQIDEDDAYDAEILEGDLNTFKWGYGVHRAWIFRDMHSDPRVKPLTRFKLLLSTDAQTEKVRAHLAPTLKDLRTKKIIKSELHVIADYLTCLLRHAKQELQFQNLYDNYDVEIVLCVPAIWSQKACRDMQTALSISVRGANFERVDVQHNSIKNLFVVSEPEAAAAYVLENSRNIRPNDTFVLLDAGGGTVDVNTYTVSQTTPLRLKAESTPPQGWLCGSSYLNEGFRELIRQRLASATYLEENDVTLDAIAETITMNEFEYRCKRSFNVYNPAERKPILFACEGLREDLPRGYRRNRLLVRGSDIARVFRRCLEPIKRLLLAQINAAAEKGVRIDKVVVIGGFSGSPSLRKCIEESLQEYEKAHGIFISPIYPESDVSAAVASGAVLRALNKDNGPQRHAQSSYGVIRTEPYDSEREHKEAKATPYRDKCDGEWYVRNTIYWILKLRQTVDPVWFSEPLLCSHNIACYPPAPLVCEELLYVSDHASESHYSKRHTKNRGSQLVGRIVADFSFLKTRGLIAPTEPEVDDKGRPVGKRHYKVQYTLIVKVVDRDLKCYAIYDGEIVTQCRINIASGFMPGVK